MLTPYEVILIDDSRLDNFINEKVVKKCGIANTIEVFSSAQHAIDKISGEKDHEPRLIFLDIQMPILNGFQFLEKLSSLPLEVRYNYQIIMLSSSINPNDQDRAKDFYPLVRSYLKKPLTEDSLMVAIAALAET